MMRETLPKECICKRETSGGEQGTACADQQCARAWGAQQPLYRQHRALGDVNSNLSSAQGRSGPEKVRPASREQRDCRIAGPLSMCIAGLQLR
jgi:hypothetical protein